MDGVSTNASQAMRCLLQILHLQHILPGTYLSGADFCCEIHAWWGLQLILFPEDQVSASLLTAHIGLTLEH